jgi:hypothetical protein
MAKKPKTTEKKRKYTKREKTVDAPVATVEKPTAPTPEPAVTIPATESELFKYGRNLEKLISSSMRPMTKAEIEAIRSREPNPDLITLYFKDKSYTVSLYQYGETVRLPLNKDQEFPLATY